VSLLRIKAYAQLIRFGSYLAREDFAGLCESVRKRRLCNKTFRADSIERVCAAVDRACIFYWKEVRCLQRAAATTTLLKDHGVSAEMIIGVQQIPFKAHAWVEFQGRVVNDKPYTGELYAVIDRC
jgi:hypothetical protein